MKIYGFDASNPTNKVRYVANYLGLKYEFVPRMPFSEDVQNDEYRTLHPAEKVPSLEIDGTKLFESNAIIRYLAQKNKSPLYPENLEQRAVVDEWMDFASLHIATACARVFWNRLGYKFAKEEQDTRSLEAGLKFLSRFLPVVDKRLGQNKYLAGNDISLADFSMLAALDSAEAFQVDLSPYKNITAWRSKLQAEKFYQVDRSQGEAIIKQLMAA